MQRAINRFWDWLFHPSVRAYENLNLKASIYRYPSPGNARDNNLTDTHYEDYKTPYEHSRYNVRYSRPAPAQTADKITQVKADSPALTPLLKLKRTGFLKDGEENNVDLLAEAKKKYLQKFGVPVDKYVYASEEVNVPKSANREDLAAFIQSFYQDVRVIKKTGYDYSIDRKTIDDPEVMPLESVDMFVSPHFQQGRIVNEYLIDQQINNNVKNKKIQAYVGDARFWKAIDDSFPTTEIEKIQNHVRDPEPTAFEYRKSGVELEFNPDGKIADVHPKH